MLAYNYLDMVNAICDDLNEVNLTSATFPDTIGFYNDAKRAVNYAIRDIIMSHIQWPFLHVDGEEVLTPGLNKYPFPNDTRHIDFDSFRVVPDSSLDVDYVRLKPIAYDEYLQKYGEEDYKAAADGGVPEYVFKRKSNEWGIYPTPDKAYTLEFDYFRKPVDLNLWSDVPSIPEEWRHVIHDRAMYYAYMFRDNYEAAQLAAASFRDDVKHMRTILINVNETMRSGYIEESYY